MVDKVIGIDIVGTNLRGALVNREGDILRRMKISSEADQGIDTLIENLADFVEEISEGERVENIGIGIAGIIDSKEGVITQAPNVSHADDYPIRAVLDKKLGGDMRVVIENDSSAAALGEWWLGAAKGEDSMIMITMGTGIGGLRMDNRFKVTDKEKELLMIRLIRPSLL